MDESGLIVVTNIDVGEEVTSFSKKNCVSIIKIFNRKVYLLKLLSPETLFVDY